MRTALSQFGWWPTPEAAAAYLATAGKTADNHGDRVAAERRAASLPGYEYPVLPTVAELRRKVAQWTSHTPTRGRR